MGSSLGPVLAYAFLAMVEQQVQKEINNPIQAEFAHPVFEAAHAGNLATLQQLFDNDPQLINRPDYDSEDSLTCAVKGESIECVQLLFASGARTDYRTMSTLEVLPLLEAVRRYNVEMTRLILYNLDMVFHQSSEPIYWHEAMKPTDLTTSLELFKLLEANAVPFSSKDFGAVCCRLKEEFAHPVFEAAHAGNLAALQQLFANDPQLINRPDYDSEDSLTCAVKGGSIECVKLLFSSGARTDYRTMPTLEVLPLLEAVRRYNVEMTRLILYNLDMVFHQSSEPIYWHEAMKPTDLTTSLELFKLLEANAVPFSSEDFGAVCRRLKKGDAHPVFEAARSGDVAKLRELFTNDPQLINRQDGQRYDPMSYAVMQESIECVQLLFASGAKTNYTDEELSTSHVLSLTLRYGTMEIARLILRTLVYNTPSVHNYWTEAMTRDLSDTWKKFKLLEEYGFPFSPENCDNVCGNLFTCEPSDPDLEEFILHLCSILKPHSDGNIERSLLGLNIYCLRVVIPHKGSFDIIRYLQSLNLYRPPSNIKGWTDAFDVWNQRLPPFDTDQSKVETLIHELILSKCDSTPRTRPFLHNADLDMVVLFAVLILVFPHPSWYEKQSQWLGLIRSREQNPSEWPALGVDYMDFMTLFFQVLLEQVLSEFGYGELGRGILEQEFFRVLDEFMKYVDLSHINMMFRETVNTYLICDYEGACDLLLDTMRQYILPQPLSNACFDGAMEYPGVSFGIEPRLFETIMDYSPEMALHFILTADGSDPEELGENSPYFNTTSLENDQAIHRKTHDCPLNTMYSMRAPNDSDFEPLSLCVLTKRAFRCHLRHILYFGSKFHRKPLSSSINQLPLPEKMRHWLNRCDIP